MKYLLLHGSWHGSWCWDRVTPFLKEKGHEVECIDLPGYTLDQPSQVTYQDYYTDVEQVISQQKEPIVLVSHSMSGIIAGPLADRLSHKVKHAFFIAAFLPNFGQSLIDVALTYDNSEIYKVMDHDTVNLYDALDINKAREFFYHDCSKEVKEWASKQLRPQPYAPLETALDWEDTLLTKDQRTYIICEQDRIVHVDAQRKMTNEHPSRVISMEIGHFPMFSRPEELSKILTDQIN